MLRPFVESDAARIELLLNDKEIASNTRTIDYPYPEGGAVEWIAKVTLWRETGDGYAFAICRPENGGGETLIDENKGTLYLFCLLYTSPSPRDATLARMPSSA